jgi:hypothetical protein
LSLLYTGNGNGDDIRATVRMKWSIVVTLLSLAGAVGAQATQSAFSDAATAGRVPAKLQD